jgi:prepilin-type processing-associated H-X9-DG protein
VNRGKFPGVFHEAHDEGEEHEGGDEHEGSDRSMSWIFTLAPFVESVDEIRLCSEDVARLEMESARITSYALNGYLRDVTQADVVYAPDSADDLVNDFDGLIQTHATITVMEAGTSVEVQFDHLDSWQWFGPDFATAAARWARIQEELAVDRHTGGMSNFLYADGHVAAISAEQLETWAMEGFNFVIPPQQ